MVRKNSKLTSRALNLLAVLVAAATISSTRVLAQNGYDRGTPAESKGGLSSLSTYAQDKIETVNLANGNLALHIPLVAIGGRGSASYNLALTYNSKLWTGQHTSELVQDCQPCPTRTIDHFAASFDDGVLTKPNLVALGCGWSISKGPTIRARSFGIDPINNACPNVKEGAVYKYVLTKVWLLLPDGSEVEMRDDLTDGAPHLKSDPCGSDLDGDRGRVWHSTDGSAITYVTDVDNGVVAGNLDGWVFLADGTKLKMGGGSMGGNARCKKVFDPNGNTINITYDDANNMVTYTDAVGRQVILQWSVNSSGIAIEATVTITGYNGLADRVIRIDTDTIGATDASGNPVNLRSDFWSLQRPFYSGDYTISTQGETEHTDPNPHTDVFFHSDEAAAFTDITDEETTVTRLTLLDGRSFRFHYNQFGELAEIVYPGEAPGVSQIDYAAFGSSVCEGGGTVNPQLNRRVTQRRTLTDGTNVDATWVYTRGSGTIGGTSYPTVTVEAHQGGVTGTSLLSETHYFLGLDAEYRTCSVLKGSNGTAYEKFENAREFRVERQTGSGTQVVATKDWQQRAQVDWGSAPYRTEHGQEQPPNDPRVLTEDTILENNKLKRVSYDYDNFNNVTSILEYDFGTSPNAGTLLRQTARTYVGALNGYCYTNINGVDGSCGSGVYSTVQQVIHRRRLLVDETVEDGAGAVATYTKYEYDNYTNDGGNHAAIQTNTGMIQYDGSWFSSFAAQSQPRGNVTSVKRLISGSIASGTYVTAYSQYDEAGNVVLSLDANGNATAVSYVDNFGDGAFNPESGSPGPSGPTFAFPSLVTNALSQQLKHQYDYSRGVQTGMKDPNQVVTQTIHADVFDRPTQIKSALGTGVENHATIYYAPTTVQVQYPNQTYLVPLINNDTLILKDQTNVDDKTFLRYIKTDGFDRTTQNLARDPQGDVLVNTTYDGMGRTKRVTNPYRSTSDPTYGYTDTTLDLLGRLTRVETFDSSAASTGAVTTAYSGNQVTVTDQAGKMRRTITDGLGRLQQVIEDPNGLAYSTTYGYDALDDLTSVTQGSQTRTFVYDDLKRLTSASNPESGAVNYTQYDGNGNLLQKTDARGITTNYAYDPLNRVTSRTYPNDPQSTPAVSYVYDSQSLPSGAPTFTRGSSVGRLVAVTYGATSAGNYQGYDQLGRVNVSVQQTDSQNYAFSYGYDLASEMTSETYPSGRVVQTEYDAAGRIAGVRNQGAPSYYAGSTATDATNRIQYSAHGAVSAMKLGNGKWEHTNFNSRFQPTQIGLGTSSADSSMLELDYGFGTTSNNGNVLSQRIIAGTGGMDVTQNYSYDALNRLGSATEVRTSDGSQQWQQTYDYDRYGNRAIRNTSYIPSPSLTPQSANSTDFSAFNQASNKIVLNGFGYDNAGNLTSDPTTPLNGIVYDAENRQIQYTKSGQSTNSYYYDGEGRRVKKVVGSTTTVFVYNASGQLIAEYDGTNMQPLASTKYVTADHLGSTRVVTKADGSVKTRLDYLPFGEELSAGVGLRTSGIGYSVTDSTRQKFTSKERDAESGLDYFGERYYSSAQGRFISVDPLGASAIIADPQSFNRYTYVVNNPLRYVDPDGLDAKNPWAGLSDEERRLLASKLTFVNDRNSPTKVELAAAGKVFNDKVTVKKDGVLDVKLTEANIASVQNFVHAFGGDSKIWNEIGEVRQVLANGDGKQSDVQFTVINRENFLKALTDATDVEGNKRFTYIGKDLGHMDSTRGLGFGVSDPSAHVENYPAEGKWNVHWDPTSFYTKRTAKEFILDVMPGGFLRRPAAGAMHSSRATASSVNEFLKKELVAPQK